MCYVNSALNFYDDHARQQTVVINRMINTVETINRGNGWYDSERSFGDDVALLHSEVSEMFEGFRKDDWTNVAEELADVLIRVLDTAGRYGIDLSLEFKNKCEKNRARGYRHGGKAV